VLIHELVQNSIDAKDPAPPKAEPEWPQKEKLTLQWLFQHMPVSAWAVVAGGLSAAFTLGMTVGGWDVTKQYFTSGKASAKAASTP
jgi:hypothetical protein